MNDKELAMIILREALKALAAKPPPEPCDVRVWVDGVLYEYVSEECVRRVPS
jgi:hypothetical protein